MRRVLGHIRLLLGIIVVVLLGVVLIQGRVVLLPMVLASLLTLTLSPIVRLLSRHGSPEGVSATLVVMALGGVLVAGGYLLADPVSQWISDAPRIGAEVSRKLAILKMPMDRVVDATKKVEEAAQAGETTGREVVVKQPGFLAGMTDGLGQGMAMVGTTLVLTLFLLASGRLFPEKLVHSLPLFGDKLRVLRVLRDVEREVSTYLLTITLINMGLGAAVGLALALIGMPNPAVWAVVAMALNYLPFLGSILGVLACALVSLVTFPTVEMAIWPPLAYAGLTLLEGQLITPTLVGRRLAINSVAVVLAVLVWAWIWGIPGALIAVPLLVVVKVVCGHFKPLRILGEFLSTRRSGALIEASLGDMDPRGISET